jgi:hypothetical protein
VLLREGLACSFAFVNQIKFSSIYIENRKSNPEWTTFLHYHDTENQEAGL